jgi:hypothetical protein
MKKAVILAVSCALSCALAFPAIAFAQPAQTKAAPAHEVRKVPPVVAAPRSGILRQDLFDRNNSNNLRSDWPSPPAQPAQF